MALNCIGKGITNLLELSEPYETTSDQYKPGFSSKLEMSLYEWTLVKFEVQA